jgi:CRP/FNR family cyclic AMP-dependent transcriptional regulator
MTTPPASEHQIWQLPRETVDALAAVGTLRTFAKNTVVIQEGDYGDTMFVVLSGRVRVFLADEEGREVLLGEYGAGEHFGEMMLDHGPRSASVATLEPTRCAVVTRDELEAFLEAHPKTASIFVRMLIGRVRILTRTVGNLALLDVYGRVARHLLDSAVEENGRLVIPGRLTNVDIAKRVGASREMVGRIIADLKRGGYIVQEATCTVIMRAPPKAW